MLNNPKNIIAPKNDKSKEFEQIEKSLKKLKEQEKKLVDLYISSNIHIESINSKNESIKKEIEQLQEKKKHLDEQDGVDIKVELLTEINDNNLNKYLLNNELPLYRKWEQLNKTTRKYIIQKFIKSIEIERDEEFFIDITNIKFNKNYFSNNADDFLNELMLSLRQPYQGFIYKNYIDMETLLYMLQDYDIISVEKYLEDKDIHDDYQPTINEVLKNESLIVCSLVIDNKFIDEFIFIPKKGNIPI